MGQMERTGGMEVTKLILLVYPLTRKIDSIYHINLMKENHHKNVNEYWKNILKIYYEINCQGIHNAPTFLF